MFCQLTSLTTPARFHGVPVGFVAEGAEIEIRQVFEAADFAPSDPTGELRAKEEALRKSVQSRGR